VTAHHALKVTAPTLLTVDHAHRATVLLVGHPVLVVGLVVRAVAAVVVVGLMALSAVASVALYLAVAVEIRDEAATRSTAKAPFAHLISSKAMVQDAGVGAKTTRMRQ
jgi:hypothetical protein